MDPALYMIFYGVLPLNIIKKTLYILKRCAFIPKDYLEAFQSKINLFDRILEEDIPQISEDDKKLIEMPYPLILITECDEKMERFTHGDTEYQPTEPLQLGKDILTIATDSEENRGRLGEFLQQHNLEHINIFII